MQLIFSFAVIAFVTLESPLHCSALVFLASRSDSDSSPVTKVVQLLSELKANIVTDGKKEQESYDKSACWCEDTLQRKAKEISDAKKLIQELGTSILKLEGDVATHGVEVAQLKKEISKNKAAQKEAVDMRSSALEEYEAEKTESEQAIGALEAATTALTGAGAGKKGEFLATSMQEATLLSAAAGVRPVLGKAREVRALPEADLDVVQHFVEAPAAFVVQQHPRTTSTHLGALQVKNNPFGDYAPQSTQIQGILKGLYESFASSLEKANVAEAEEQKAHKELMATKSAELKTLEASLEQHELGKATKSKDMAESKELRQDTQVGLDANEAVFKETKSACKDKAMEWSKRSSLRLEEQQGISEAIAILNSPEAKATFGNATTTLVQVRSVSGKAKDAARQLRALALREDPQTRSGLLKVASKLETGGHFDKVMASIDSMMKALRAEEQDDINHRDRCQGDQNKNKNDMEDLEHEIGKSGSEISRMEDKADGLETAIANLDAEINATKTDLDEALGLRNKEVAAFKQALSDDTSAIDLLDQALVALTKFYKKNKIPFTTLVQRQEPPAGLEPEYTVDKDKMVHPSWDGPGYQGKQDDSTPILSMIAAIKEDLEKEVQLSRESEASTQEAYEKESSKMRESLTASENLKAATAKELAELNLKLEEVGAHKANKEADLSAEGKLKDALYSDCSWVETHFESRRLSRKSEMDGLAEAKNFLAGMEPL